MALDAACEAYWNSMFPDGWSWREMHDGEAGNSPSERDRSELHAKDIVTAIECAVAAYQHHNPAATPSTDPGASKHPATRSGGE